MTVSFYLLFILLQMLFIAQEIWKEMHNNQFSYLFKNHLLELAYTTQKYIKQIIPSYQGGSKRVTDQMQWGHLGRVVRIKPNQLYGALANEEQPNFGLFTAKLWNQVPSLDLFVVQNSGDFLCWKYK